MVMKTWNKALLPHPAAAPMAADLLVLCRLWTSVVKLTLLFSSDVSIKLTDFIISLLCLAHLMTVFESLNFWEDLKCQALFYMNRVMRDLAITTTCLLSMRQAVTVSPSILCRSPRASPEKRATQTSLCLLGTIEKNPSCSLIFPRFSPSEDNMGEGDFPVLSPRNISRGTAKAYGNTEPALC
ncbi:PREDICTED: uncharacterized protein LOC105521564 [Colobus angolensis palliatus]|uniref:uncharacterized protein LOC105521564 n=1 Tax=Colobus angolensis palliatus TaxID=336983 RepID=UPI0005F3C800|nr:PREDICTED: uncharacterized protein LOC105521564 [Colobus angolensis palliatus]